MNGLATITINGQQVGLRFAYPAIKWFSEASMKNGEAYFTDGAGGGFTVEGLAKLFQCSYRNNCLIKEVEPVLTYEDFYNWVDERQGSEEGQAELVKVTEIYAEATVMKKMVEAQKKSQTSL